MSLLRGHFVQIPPTYRLFSFLAIVIYPDLPYLLGLFISCDFC